MSTKIYNAWLLPAYVELYMLMRLFGDVKKATHRVATLGRSWVLPNGGERDNETIAKGIVRSAQSIVSGEHGTCANSSAVLYVHPDKPHQWIVQFFGLPCGTMQDIGKCMRRWKATSFEYENQTDDLPAGVSRKQYAERKKAWDKILGPDGIPERAGLSYEFMTVHEELIIMLQFARRAFWPANENTNDANIYSWAYAVAHDMERQIRNAGHKRLESEVIQSLMLRKGSLA